MAIIYGYITKDSALYVIYGIGMLHALYTLCVDRPSYRREGHPSGQTGTYEHDISREQKIVNVDGAVGVAVTIGYDSGHSKLIATTGEAILTMRI